MLLYRETVNMAQTTRQKLRRLAAKWEKLIADVYESPLAPYMPKGVVKAHVLVCHLEV